MTVGTRLLPSLGLFLIAVLAAIVPTQAGTMRLAAEETAGQQPTVPKGATLVPLDMNAIYIALDYDSKAVPRAIPVIQKFFDAHIPILPLPKGVVTDRFDPGLNVVYWNSTAALQTATDSGAGTGKYMSPALLLLDAIDHAVAYSLSPEGYENLAASPVPLFGDMEKQRAISGLSSASAKPDLHRQTESSVAGAVQILDFAEGNGLGNAAAAAVSEPVRTNDTVVLKDGEAVEGMTYMTTTDPTWHKN
jgi:hypothetical protein